MVCFLKAGADSSQGTPLPWTRYLRRNHQSKPGKWEITLTLSLSLSLNSDTLTQLMTQSQWLNLNDSISMITLTLWHWRKGRNYHEDLTAETKKFFTTVKLTKKYKNINLKNIKNVKNVSSWRVSTCLGLIRRAQTINRENSESDSPNRSFKNVPKHQFSKWLHLNNPQVLWFWQCWLSRKIFYNVIL